MMHDGRRTAATQSSCNIQTYVLRPDCSVAAQAPPIHALLVATAALQGLAAKGPVAFL